MGEAKAKIKLGPLKPGESLIIRGLKIGQVTGPARFE